MTHRLALRRSPSLAAPRATARHHFRHATHILPLTLLVTVACSWQRFDEVTENTPVAVFDPPGNGESIGRSVAAIEAGSTTLVFGGGENSYGVYDFGRHNSPGMEAIYGGVCGESDGCRMSPSAAPIHRVVDGAEAACFAYAVATNSEKPSVRLTCEGDRNLGVALDTESAQRLGNSVSSSSFVSRFTSSPRKHPRRLLVSSTPTGTLWYYPDTAGASVPIAVDFQVSDSFGAALAIVPSALSGATGSVTLVVGEPGAGRVHFYVTDSSGLVTGNYCVVGREGLGQHLAAGYFDQAQSATLAVSDANQVTVLTDLGQIEALASTDRALAPEDCLPIERLSVSTALGCTNLGLHANCASSLTLLSLAPADLNDDGLEELLIGVPLADGQGQSAAGQVLTTQLKQAELQIRERLTISSSESGDRLGESVAAVPLSRPDVVLAGAPGGNKIAAFYCSTLVPNGQGGKRCE